jgi:D-alanine-D-alanine ligase
LLRLGVFYNLREDFPLAPGDPVDAAADWDIAATVDHILCGLERAGCRVADLGDPRLLLDRQARDELDLVLSICEMTGYRFRESLVPGLCELLDLPYMLSSPDVLVTALDKNLTNLLAAQAGVPVSPWALVSPGQGEEAVPGWEPPLVVKPAAEGSGMGVSLVHSRADLQGALARAHANYGQPAIVQRYLPGREFTVGVLERDGRPTPLGVIETAPAGNPDFFLYGYEAKEGEGPSVTFPALADESLAARLQDIATAAFAALGCRDGARVDIRLDEDGEPRLLEINPLPHLHPAIGDFCRSGKADGLEYTELLGALVASSCRRWRL